MIRAQAALVACVGLLVCGAGLAAWTWRTLNEPYRGWAGPSTDVVLEPGLDAASMLERLTGAGVLDHSGTLRRWLSLRGGADRLRAGEYRFEAPASPLDVLRRLEAGDVLLHAVTLPEGLTLRESADRIAEVGLGTRDALLAAFADPAPIRDLDAEATDLEGYLFPDTYHFSRGMSAGDIAGTMVRRFREVVGPDYGAAARRVGLDLRDAVVLGSLIEKETGVPGERPRIARVFHNRLARGMKLECDPTVIYAHERSRRALARPLTHADLQLASPWNTYRVTGLPPGPIASPGRESLDAAVHPAAGPELYFVAAPGGGHRFSTALAEHVQAVAAWRRYTKSAK